MSQSLRELIDGAVAAGEVIRVVYHGGSQPGSVREIAPVRVFDDEVDALCVASGERKTFKLDRIEIPAAGALLTEFVAEAGTQDDRPLEVVFREALPELHALGWHVAMEGSSIRLQALGFFKNGKPRKPRDIVVLSYEELMHDYIDFDGKEVMRKSARPYSVRSERTSTRTFAQRWKAILVFWEEARALAPRDQQGPDPP